MENTYNRLPKNVSAIINFKKWEENSYYKDRKDLIKDNSNHVNKIINYSNKRQ